MRRPLLLWGAVLSTAAAMAAQTSVHVEPAHLDGPRQLDDSTAQGAIRDYLEAWKAMGAALDENQPQLLAQDFVGTAKDALADTIHQQAMSGIQTHYLDRSHDLQIVLYSPEGLSIELTDTVDYDLQVFDHGKQIASQPVHAHYVAILTPAEVRWKVRVLQAQVE